MIDQTEKYNIDLIVFHNTEQSNYVELPISKSLINLSGTNAVGKTSKVMALPIINSPYDNFNRSSTKFGFNKDRTNLETYNYYFPEENSFIISQHTNPDGVFCQIIMRSKETLGIQRAFIDKPFTELKEWFIYEDLSATKISKTDLILKIKSNNGQIITSKQMMEELMFKGDYSIQGSEKYNIAKVRNDNVKVFLDCYKCLLSPSDTALQKNIMVNVLDNHAQSINANKINLPHQIEKLKMIVSSIDEAERIEEFRETFDDLTLNLKSYYDFRLQYSRFSIENAKIANFYKLKQKELQQSITDLEECKTTTLNANKTLETATNDLSNKKSLFGSRKNDLNKRINESQTRIKEFELFKEKQSVVYNNLQKEDEYKFCGSISEMIESLTETIDKYQTTLNQAKPIVSTKKKEDILKAIAIIKREKSSLDNEKRDVENTIELSDENKRDIQIINKILSISISEENYLNNISICTSLINLVNINEDEVTFLDTYYGKIPKIRPKRPLEEILQDLEANERNLLVQEKSLEREKLLLEALTSKLNDRVSMERKVVELKENIKSLKLWSREKKALLEEKQKELIEDNNQLDREIKTYKSETSLLEKEIEDLVKVHKSFKLEQQQKQKLNDTLRNEIADIEKTKHKVINDIHTTMISETQLDKDLNTITDCDYDKEFIKEIPNIIRDRKRTYTAISKSIEDFFISKIIDQTNYSSSEKQELSYNDITIIHQDLESIYATNKESRKERYKNATDDKNSIFEYLSSVDDLARSIDKYIIRLNTNIDVSDVKSMQSVKVKYELTPQIRELCEKIKVHQEENDELSLNQLKSIIDYFTEFSNKFDSSNISIKDMIKNVYTVIENNNGDTTTIGSGGQTVIVNLIFIASIFETILEEDTSINLPMLTDELGVLDDFNKIFIIQLAKSHGYFILSASPTLNFFDIESAPTDFYDLDLSTLFTKPDELTSTSNKFNKIQTYHIDDYLGVELLEEDLNND
nr:hypothetical protein [Moritella viscosa]SHO15522.1 Putative uncharacterized protein [Moritella viscosa]